MIPVRVKNKFSDYPQKIMRPVSIRLSEEMISLLEATSKELGFKRIQGLIRLYIRQGLDRDHQDYTLANGWRYFLSLSCSSDNGWVILLL